MKDKKFLLVLNGPMCAGKSTVAKIFMQRDGLFRGSYDAIKWLISNYSADDDHHRKIAKEIAFSGIKKAIESGLSVVIDGGWAEYRKEYQDLAKENKLEYLSVNIEAPIKILEERFLSRVESAQLKNSKTISVTTLEGFYSRYQWYLNTNKDFSGIVLDSSVLNAEEIVIEIDRLLTTT